jgi:hypothetical protein
MSYTTQRSKRDSGLNNLSTLQGDLHGLVKAAQDGYGIKVELSYGWLYARRAVTEKFDVAVYGSGGGFVWRRKMTRVGLRNIVLAATPDDPQVRRGPVSEVWPLD